MRKALLFIFIVAFLSNLNAQESCVEKIYNANKLFEKGQISEAIAIAKTCANDNNSITDQWQAYHLLAIAYLVNDQRSEARKAAEKMIELNPTYKPGSKDPKDLEKMLKTVKVIPKFSIGMAVAAGGNKTFPNVTANYNGADYDKEYKSRSSWQLGLMVGKNMNEIISLHTGLIASNKKFEIDYGLEGKNIKVKENLTYLDLPLFARFTSQPKNGFSYFGDIGIFGGRLISAKSSFSISDTLTTKSANNLNSESRRNNWEYGVLGGVGVMYKFSKSYLSIDARYYLASFYNATNKDNRYKNSGLFYNYYFLDDDYRLNNLAISISFVQYLNYKVIKGK